MWNFSAASGYTGALSCRVKDKYIFIMVFPDTKVECNELPHTCYPTSTVINSWLISKDDIFD